MSMLDALLQVKRLRETLARAAWTRQHGRKMAAEADVDIAARRLDECRRTAAREEASMYGRLCGMVVRVRDIERVREDVAGLRDQVARHEQSVRDAGTRLACMEHALGESHEACCSASVRAEKFTELRRTHLLEHLRDRERKEEQEMDEAVCGSPATIAPAHFGKVEPE